jgi:hypothetical protein
METNQNISNIRGPNTNLSYFTLRKIIGYSGLLLPFICWAFAWKYESSISDYYYTRSGVFFTSILTLCGAFLIAYRGEEQFEETISDNIITWIAGILIFIVAFVPTPFSTESPCNCGPTPICHCSNILGWIHFGSAALFFLSMGYLSIFRFRRDKNPEDRQKVVRYFIYLICGIVIWAVLLFAGFMIFFFDVKDHFVFWIEVVLLLSFGISWLVKGKALVDLGIQKEDYQL